VSHVVLGGDEHQVSELLPWLKKWGITTGHLGSEDPVPTVWQCDVVIWSGQPDRYQGACQGTLPDGSGGAAGPAAPLIFITAEKVPSDLMPVGAISLVGPGPDVSRLRSILRDALVRSQLLRGEFRGDARGCEVDDADAYLHFLGHELRSPLTAIKTALEVLESDPGGSQAGPADFTHKMLNIALRNVRRLHQTMDWSQELLAAGVAPVVASPREVTVAELASGLARLGAVEVDAECRAQALETDPELVEALVAQMTRAVIMACPEQTPMVALDLCSESPQTLRVVVTTIETVAEPDTFDRVARFLTSPRLVEALGARMQTDGVRSDRPALAVIFKTLRETVPALC